MHVRQRHLIAGLVLVFHSAGPALKLALKVPELRRQLRREIVRLEVGDQQLLRPEGPERAVLAVTLQHKDQVARLERQSRRIEIARQLRQKLLPSTRLRELALVPADPANPRMDGPDQ